MSAWGAFAGGVGGAAAQLSGKYIDEELMQQRAQALSDMQFANSKRTEEYTQSEAVQGPRLLNAKRELEQRGTIALDQQTAAHKQGNKLKIADSQDPELAAVAELAASDANRREVGRQDALRPGAIATAEATSRINTGGQIELERVRQSGRMAEIDATEARKEKLKTAFDKLPERTKLEVQSMAGDLKDINKAITEAQAGGQWEPSKVSGQKELELRKAALTMRIGSLLNPQSNDDPLGVFAQKDKPAGDAPKPDESPSQAPSPKSTNLIDQARADKDQKAPKDVRAREAHRKWLDAKSKSPSPSKERDVAAALAEFDSIRNERN